MKVKNIAFGSSVMLLSCFTPALAAEPFRIGLPIELSGRFVAYGAQIKRGVDLAMDAWKATRGSDTVDGHPIELVTRDVQSNTSVTVSAMNELIDAEKVAAIIGPGASNIGAAAVPPWLKSENRPIWVVPGVATAIVEKQVGKDPYFFHTFAWTYDYHLNNALALKSFKPPMKTLAFLYSDGAFGRSLMDTAPKYFEDQGFRITDRILVREGANDFTSALLRIKAHKPDVLYVLAQTDDAVLIARQIRTSKLGIKVILGTANATLPEWKTAVGDLQECWTGVTTYLPDLPYPADTKEPKLFPSGVEWAKMFRAKYHKEPEYMEAGAYVSMILTLLAEEKVDSFDREKLGGALSAQSYETPLGNSTFGPSDIISHQAFSKMVVFQQQKIGDIFKSVLLYPPEVAQGELKLCPE